MAGAHFQSYSGEPCIAAMREAATGILDEAGSGSWTRMVLVNEVYASKDSKPQTDTVVSAWSRTKRYSRTGTTITATDDRFALAIIGSEKRVIIRNLSKKAPLHDPLLSFKMLRDSVKTVNCLEASPALTLEIKDAWVKKSQVDALFVELRRSDSKWVIVTITTDYTGGRPVSRTITKAPSFENNIKPLFEHVVDLVLDEKGALKGPYRRYTLVDLRA